MKKMINVEIMPATGPKNTISVDATGVSIGEALTAAGYDPNAFNVRVDGSTVDTNAHIADGAKVTLTERVKGS